ncbi:MAG: response regulator transcription factor [Pyrinomonadaceae bacterium]|nr:response regulator transcription factor [Pyrinomonadaceae bacterium]
MRILLVEDESGLVMTLTDRLRTEGYDVVTATDGDEGLSIALEGNLSAIILDVMLPKKNGFDVARDLRQQGVETPILMLTAKGEIIDKVLGLKLGADDYMTKPFEMAELLARLEALIRRSSTQDQNTVNGVFRFGEIDVDLQRAEVRKRGEAIELSAMEFRLLQFFLNNRGVVHSRDDLLDAVWGYDSMPTTRTVDVHIAWLRQKLEENPKRPKHIQTVHGMGYKFIT